MSPHGVKTLQVRFPSDTVEKLLRQLVETNLQCKLDDSLLKAKKRDLQNLQVHVQPKHLTVSKV